MLQVVRKFLHSKRLCLIFSENHEKAVLQRDEIEFYLRGFSASGLRVKLFNSDAFFPYRDRDLEFLRGEEANLLFSISREPSETDFVILTPEIFLRKFTHPVHKKEQSIKISLFDELDTIFLAEILTETGYRRVEMAYEQGEFAIRGGIVDIYSPVNEYPVRIELFGKRVESIRFYDPDTQSSISAVSCAEIYPVEIAGAGATESHPFFSYIPDDAAIICEDRNEVARSAELFLKRTEETWMLLKEGDPVVMEPREFYISAEEFLHLLEKREKTNSFHGAWREHELMPQLNCRQSLNNPALMPNEKLKWLIQGNDSCPLFVVALPTEADINRVSAILIQQGTAHSAMRFGFLCGGAKGIVLAPGIIPHTFIDRETGAMFISSVDIFGHKFLRREHRKAKGLHFVEIFKELDVGDYVVHRDYGIGIYRGLVELKVSSCEGETGDVAKGAVKQETLQEFLLIEYRDGDKLYCPVYKLDLVQKYLGGGEVTLDKLGTKGWERKKAQAGVGAKEMAEKLIKLYAERELCVKEPFSRPNSLYREFETSFPYELTEDQEKAIEDVLWDMSLERCMDRLVCGDVGFGKTEVAVRAAFKAVEDGRQVAVLVPTTILAEQHFHTFSERFKNMPVVIESLSRLRTKGEQKEILRGLAEGKIDIVIGTHRLLSVDIKFKKLGLLIIDEEHRFGVAQKEKFKEIKRDIDCISMTATPIPRTLNMSLSGIRDISVIYTPPRNRSAIKSSIIKFNRAVIREGVLRELNRGGQVFFLHNRVSTIGKMKKILEEIVPEARVDIAHGQMKPVEIEKTMLSFLKGDINLLLCSAIIESGIDIPRANTIFINRADTFGISQLYQIRGRVGRSSEQAYAYLIVPDRINDEAMKRLNTIRKFGELGSGFILSMHDLEIRGAGNILGREQSGHIYSIGFEMYSDLLNEEVRKLRGEEVKVMQDAEISVDVQAGIMESYIADQKSRLYYYKKIASAENATQLEEIRSELSDRYGSIPAALKNLFDVVRIKQYARAAALEKIEKSGKNLYLTCRDPDIIEKYLKGTSRKWCIEAGNRIRTSLNGRGEGLREVVAILQEISVYGNGEKELSV